MPPREILLTTVLILNVITTRTIKLPDDLKTWCPHTKFCSNGSNKDQHVDNIPRAMNSIPCCSSCSCSKDCGRKRNCCRYEDDLFRIEETLDTTCRQLVLHSPNLGSDFPHFYVIDKCPNRTETCFSRSSHNEDLFPVYSNDTGMIYHNDKCAKCHGQRSLLPFLQIVTCSSISKSYFTAVFTNPNLTGNYDCVTQFIPPDGVKISTERCYPFKINQCGLSFNASREHVYLCSSFNATFHTKFGRHYGNVYCLLCNTVIDFVSISWSTFYEFCPSESNLRSHSLHFSYILQSWNRHDKQQEYKDSLPIWCKDSRSETCRQLFCPEGQTYFNGVCKQMASKWYFKCLQITIYLSTPPGYTRVSSADLLQDMKDSRIDGNLRIDRPGFEDWNLAFLYNIDYSNKAIRYFIAMLQYKHTHVVPEQIIGTAKRSIYATLWTLYLNKNKYKLKPRFNKYSIYRKINDFVFVPEWYNFIHLLNVSNVVKPSLNTMAIRFLSGDQNILHSTSDSFHITILFFCTLIELNNQEYEPGVLSIFFKATSKVLVDGEFLWVDTEFGIPKVRICLDEIQEEQFSSCSFREQCHLMILLICVSYLFIQQMNNDIDLILRLSYRMKF